MLRQQMVLGGQIGIARPVRYAYGGIVGGHTLLALGVSVVVHLGLFGGLWFSRIPTSEIQKQAFGGISADRAVGGFVRQGYGN